MFSSEELELLDSEGGEKTATEENNTISCGNETEMSNVQKLDEEYPPPIPAWRSWLS